MTYRSMGKIYYMSGAYSQAMEQFKLCEDCLLYTSQDDSQGKASYIPSIRGKTGSSLKLIGTKGNMDWVAFGLKLVSGWDATGMNAVELYIRKTPADKQSDNGAYRFAITEGGGTAQWETFRLKEKAKVLYMEKGGSTLKETEVLEDGVCMLPSGFEGIVRLPLDQFVYWYGGTAGNDKQIQKDNLYSLTITTDVNADTQYLVVDEISAIENIRYIGSQSPDTGAAACAGAAVAALDVYKRQIEDASQERAASSFSGRYLVVIWSLFGLFGRY